MINHGALSITPNFLSGVASSLLLLAVLNELLLTVSHAHCETDYHGPNCDQQCRCKSPVTGYMCACASINGQCDMMCMTGEMNPVHAGSTPIVASVLGAGSLALILVLLILLIWNRDLLDHVKNPSFVHRTRGSLRMSATSAPNMSSLEITASRMKAFFSSSSDLQKRAEPAEEHGEVDPDYRRFAYPLAASKSTCVDKKSSPGIHDRSLIAEVVIETHETDAEDEGLGQTERGDLSPDKSVAKGSEHGSEKRGEPTGEKSLEHSREKSGELGSVKGGESLKEKGLEPSMKSLEQTKEKSGELNRERSGEPSGGN